MTDDNVENYLFLWSWKDYALWVPIGFIFSFFNFLLLSVLLILYVPILIPYSSLLVGIFTIIYSTLIILRNWMILRAFRRWSHSSLLWIPRVFNVVYTILVALAILVIIDSYFRLNFIAAYDQILIGTTFLLFYPLYHTFSKTLSQLGKVRIEFEQFFRSINDFDKRQKWLEALSIEIVNSLRRAYINISKDKLIYYVNLRLMRRPQRTENVLRNIQQWMISENRNNSILGLLEGILPREEIKPIIKPSLTSRIIGIPFDYIKFFVLILVLLIIVILRPEYMNRIIDALLKG